MNLFYRPLFWVTSSGGFFKIDRWTYLANQHIIGLEVATKHFGRFTGNRIDFHANLLTLAREFDLLVIRFDGSHDSNVHELQSNERKRRIGGQWNCESDFSIRGRRGVCVMLRQIRNNQMAAVNFYGVGLPHVAVWIADKFHQLV